MDAVRFPGIATVAELVIALGIGRCDLERFALAGIEESGGGEDGGIIGDIRSAGGVALVRLHGHRERADALGLRGTL